MRYLLLILILALLYMSDNFFTLYPENKYVPAEYVVIAKEITAQVANTMSKRYNMNTFGITTGLADSVNVLGVEFQIKGPVTKEKLREIIVDCTEEFLTLLNSNITLRPFLKSYPFTAIGIENAVFVVGQNGGNIYYPNISVAGLCGGEIGYFTEDKGNQYGYKTIEKEDYETALRIVKKGSGK